MEITLAWQVSAFFMSLAMGAILSLFFDLFRVENAVLKFNAKRVFFEDVLYFILCAIATFTYMLVTSMGEIRGYIVVGELIGWTIYRFTIGRLFYKILFAVIKFIQKKIVKIKIGISTRLPRSKIKKLLTRLPAKFLGVP